MSKQPKVGIGILIFKDGKVLLGRRLGPNGEGFYSGPGGHLEFQESFKDCAVREIREESGLEVDNIRFNTLMNFKRPDKHYVDIGIICDWKSGEPQVLEPDRCEGWSWYDTDNLPEPLFPTVEKYLEALKTGKNYFDL